VNALDTLRALVQEYPDGMLPKHACKACGNELNADGGHPAEVYLGTYTGLCYACQNGASYREKVYASGAERWNFPPHCPSWRRNRESFIGYPNCPHCSGRGRIMVSRADSHGGSYPRNCEPCSKRHYSHPVTRAEDAAYMDKVVMGKWGKLCAVGYAPADIAFDDMVRTGHATRAQVDKWILKRRVKFPAPIIKEVQS